LREPALVKLEIQWRMLDALVFEQCRQKGNAVDVRRWPFVR
jgi:hypothetical protein